MTRWLVVVAALAVALSFALVGAEGSRATVEGETGVVASVYDGDTLTLTDGRRVRLLQIDTPELGSGECYSRAARNTLLKLVPIGSRVRLDADARLDNVDRYGRLLRYIHRGPLNANTTLVRGGAAAPYFYGRDLGKYASRLLADAQKAKTAKRGLWGACPGTVLDPFRAVDTGISGPPTKNQPPDGKCDPNYAGGCIPPYPPDLDCADIRALKIAPVRVVGTDVHRLDGDEDGVGVRVNVSDVMWQDESGRVHTPLEPVVLAATLLLIPVLILEADAHGGWLTAAYVANWAIWGVFAAELLVVLRFAQRRGAALRAHWLDVAIVLLTVPLVSAALGWGRLARLVRLSRFGAIIGRALQAESRTTSGDALRVTAILTVAVVVVSGAAQWAFDAKEFPSLWDGVWWAVVTATTVGYGDFSPSTAEGRIIGIAVMAMGIAFVSLLTAALAARFVRIDNSEMEGLRAALTRIEAELVEIKASLR